MRRNRFLERLFVCVIALVAIVLTGGCSVAAPAGAADDAQVRMLRAEALARELASRRPEDLSDAEVLVLGYLERARLGLGSPFRLMEFALRDGDLPAELREQAAYALLWQVLHGRVYEVEPAVLEIVPLAGVAPRTSTGEHQLRLVERTIAAAPSATSGERIVRLGYELAAAERTVGGIRRSVVAHVAAMVADRRRAREDAAELLRAAERERISPLVLLPEWRRRQRFEVERPALVALSVREEETIARLGPLLSLSLRALAQRLSVPGSLVSRSAEDGPAPSRWLADPGTALRLEVLIHRRDYPPQAPVAVAVAINRDAYLGEDGIRPEVREQRRRFADAAWNEERFAAGLRLQVASGAGDRLRLPLMALQAAVFLRAWNQEEPWFPGEPAPAARDLVARFGLSSVTFDASVPESWRPYYLRMLGHALADLQRVVPTASVRGLAVRFGELPGGRQALALHDPRRRVLYLPPHTGPGTLAHEIAHDLDWQLARKRYGRRGGYATDLAVERRRRDRIAYALSELSASLTQPDSVRSHDRRPAEVFARGLDWFIAAAMAQEGRTGGYLTSFQDPLLTGFGTTRGPDVGGGAAPALLSILDEVAPVPKSTRDWALDRYGPHRMLTPLELARAIVNAGEELPAPERLSALERARDRSWATAGDASCRLSSAQGLRRLMIAKRSLIQASATAAARGAAVDAARRVAAETGVPRRDADRWIAWRLYGAPEPADSSVRVLEPAMEEVLFRAAAVENEAPLEIGDPFTIRPARPLCGGNPFASVSQQRKLHARVGD